METQSLLSSPQIDQIPPVKTLYCGTNIKIATVDSPQNFIEVPLEIAYMSITLKNMIDDFGGNCDTVIPLHNVNANTYKQVIEWCTYHYENPDKPSDEEDEDKKKKIELSDWDKIFYNQDQSVIFELILASNYLDIKPMLDAGCKTIANMIKNKTVEEIRKTFNIKNDFTPEEEEKVRKENEWCEDK